MIKATRHVGFVVKNLERSLAFYEKYLQFKIWKRAVETGKYIDNVVGIKDVTVEWIKLKTADGFLVELLQYHSHPSDQGAEKCIPSNRICSAHVAFTVQDVEIMHKRLTENGYYCNSVPQLSPDGNVKVMYCHDPDGIILEFVEEINK